MRVRVYASLLIATLMLLLVGAPARAQEEVTLPVSPDPSLCDAEPITADELLTISERAATPSASSETDDANGTDDEEFTLPDGQPADDETAQAITQAVVTIVSCVNAGDTLAYLNLFSDRQLTELIGPGATAEDFATIPGATPEPEENWGTVLDVREITAFDDGRVGALVDTFFRDEDNEVATGYFYFIEEDGRWKIDQVVENLGEQFPPESTPAA